MPATNPRNPRPPPEDILEQPEPVTVRLGRPDLAPKDAPRRWRVPVVTESDSKGDLDPLGLTVPVGETTWGPLPDSLRAYDGREIGEVQRMWREPQLGGQGGMDLVDVWAEGVLNAGEELPSPYCVDVIWVDEVVETRDALRRNADFLTTERGSDWRRLLADEMECAVADVGVGPVARHRDGLPFVPSATRMIVGDLRSIDKRAKVIAYESRKYGWMAGAAVPLDNDYVTNRIAMWAGRFGPTALDRHQSAELDRNYQQEFDAGAGEPGSPAHPPRTDVEKRRNDALRRLHDSASSRQPEAPELGPS